MQVLNYTDHHHALTFIDERFPFSFLKSYSSFIERTGATLYILKRDDTLVPIVIKKNKFFKTLQFHFKPLHSSAQSLSTEEETRFLNEAIDYIIRSNLVHRIVQPVNFALFSGIPENCNYTGYGSYVIPLQDQTEEQLLHNMQPRYRTAIRSAQKLNPEIRTGENELQHFWTLHKSTMDRTHMYYEPYEEIRTLYHSATNAILIANCYINNELQGGVCIAYSTYGAYYLHGASARTPASDGAIKYLHYWCMRTLKGQGVASYDFVGARLSDVSGTKLEGIQNFKKRFGSDLKKGYLWKKDISPFFCLIYDSLLILKLSLKALKVPKDIIDQEKNK